jgi:hypothetical protein
MVGVLVSHYLPLLATFGLANQSRYGMVLAKDKNEEQAMRWLIRSVHLYPMNWGCWLEMTSLIGREEDVSTALI